MPEEGKKVVTPALWTHVAKVYTTMEAEAEVELLYPEVGESEEELAVQEKGLVYTGHLTALFQELKIPNPYYTSVMNCLKKMACVEQIRRGGGTGMSRWHLLQRPTEEGFLKLGGTGQKSASRHIGRNAANDQRVRDMNKRITRLEEDVKVLTEAVIEMRSGHAQDGNPSAEPQANEVAELAQADAGESVHAHDGGVQHID
jgi:hypothetical protein